MGKSEGRVQRKRTRKETLRTFLLGMRATVDQGAFIHAIELEKADPAADVKARQDRIDAARAEPGPRKRAPKRRGAPKEHRTQAGETQADYEKRLARVRQQKYRAKKRAEKRRR